MHLDELQEKYGKKGLKVIAITNEARGLVDTFVEKTGAKHAIVIEEAGTWDAREVHSFPTAYLIGPNGKVVVPGHASDAQIEQALETARLAPEVPKALASVDGALKKEKWLDARTKTAKLIEAGTLTEDDKKSAEELIAWIDWSAQSMLDLAKSEGEKGNWYEAAQALEDAAKSYKGMPQAIEADTQLKILLADKTKKDEVTGWKKLLEARAKQKEKDLKPKEALPLFKAIVSKFENTKAGKAAKQTVDQLELAAK